MSAAQSEPLRVTVSTSSTGTAVHVHLGGDVDLAAAAALRHLAERLRAAAPSTVLVDLSGVTFACSTLANFLAQVRRDLPDQATLTLTHPSEIARLVLDVTGQSAWTAAATRSTDGARH